MAIKNQFNRATATKLRDYIYECSMDSEANRMKFQRHFILLVMQMFLCLTTQQVLLLWHIPLF
ncbi:hypothetical protein AHAS_Ahas16G0264000 [Arachis hypogaea]